MAVSYFSDQFRAAGAEPGNPDGTWVQKVPLVSITPTKFTPLVGEEWRPDTVVQARRRGRRVQSTRDRRNRLKDSELVFAGYGVQAPEYQWDDFKGLDVKGKTIVVLVERSAGGRRRRSDRSATPRMFGGNAMTYYGRWTYKYEKAAELGAAGVSSSCMKPIPAGYDFGVVQGFGGERFDLITPDKNMGRAACRAGCHSTPPRRCSKPPVRTTRS